MSNWYLLAYDVRDPKRLQRLHRRLKKEAMPLQKSVFAVHKQPVQLEKLLKQLLKLVDTRDDDLRLYPLTSPADIWVLGLQSAAFEQQYLPSRTTNKKATNLLTQLQKIWPFNQKASSQNGKTSKKKNKKGHRPS